ncbi:hypothetical protein PIB30_103448 [Stylosanthes scabra]|uniref:Uncharacterized protein n=1 Tax=Stylosanthes scabra TaxID=79078 RepID=A0ABU6RXX9_9FABA|nr:hypothetical protein [Stylosanthes scabra]
MVYNTPANSRTRASRGTQSQPLSEVKVPPFNQKLIVLSVSNWVHGLLHTSVQSLCSTLGEGVSSMRGRLIDFKAQLASQGNELRGLRNDLRGCPVISS